MSQDEFGIRVMLMTESLEPRDVSFGRLIDYVAEAIAELEEHQAYIQEVAERKLQNAAFAASVDSTPEGHRLWGYIQGNEKGCDAALRRLENRRRPPAAGSTKSEIRNKLQIRMEKAQKRPAASAPMTLTPADDPAAAPRTTVEAGAATKEDPIPSTAPPESGNSTFEAISEASNETPRPSPPRPGEKAVPARSASKGYVTSRGATANALAGAAGSYLLDAAATRTAMGNGHSWPVVRGEGVSFEYGP
jgi:hypothetical protein